jgi:hypothetical protein
MVDPRLHSLMPRPYRAPVTAIADPWLRSEVGATSVVGREARRGIGLVPAPGPRSTLQRLPLRLVTREKHLRRVSFEEPERIAADRTVEFVSGRRLVASDDRLEVIVRLRQ